jgi:hypothetical protein
VNEDLVVQALIDADLFAFPLLDDDAELDLAYALDLAEFWAWALVESLPALVERLAWRK